MRKLILIFLLLLPLMLQASVADSLRRVFTGSGTTDQKARLYFTLGRYYRGNASDSSNHYFKAAIRVRTTLREDTASMYAAAARGCLALETNSDSANSYFMYSLRLAQKYGVVDLESFLLTELGGMATAVSHYYVALDFYKRAFDIEVKRRRRDRQAVLYNRMGEIYTQQNEYSSALTYLTNALRIDDSLGRIWNTLSTYNLLSVVFSKQKKYPEALHYLRIMDSLALSIGETSAHYSIMMNKGIVHKNMGDYAQAIAAYESILKESSLDDELVKFACHNLAVAQSLTGRGAEAEKNFLAAAAINKRGNENHWFALQNYKELSRAKLRVKDIQKAVLYAGLAEEAAEKCRASAEDYKDIMLLLSDTRKAKGDMAGAYSYYQKYAALQDSIFRSEQSKGVAEAETRLHLMEKENQVAGLVRQNELQRLRSQQKNILNVTLIAGLLAGVLFVLVIIRAYRKTLRQNRLLNEQKDLIDRQVLQLGEADRMKSKFFGNISHELRTPVTLLTGMLELLQEKVTGQKEREKLSIAFGNSRKLQRMIEEMLDLSRLESGLPVFHKEALPAVMTTKRLVYAFESLMQKAEINLSFADHTKEDVAIFVDEDKFGKIINNLIYNAIKFNRPGGLIHVELATDPVKERLLITVKDSGQGIKPEDLPHIFERFYQGTAAAKPATPGSGIGLSLVKEFTTLQGGEVSVVSVPGEGSSFTLSFPLYKEQPAAGNTAIGTEDESEDLPKTEQLWQQLKNKPQILVVEDNDEMRYYLSEILSGTAEISQAVNGLEALQYLEHRQPDLIISDVMMPEMDGEVLMEHVKASPAWKKIPVIMLTALATREDQLRMLSMGVDDYILKPFNPEELKIRAYNLLHNQEIRREWNEAPTEPGELPVQEDASEEFRLKIYEYVSGKMKEPTLSVPDMAAHFAVSERQLYRLTNSLTGCSPAQLIKEVRLKKAYDLLVSGDIYKVEDVAKRVGFENPSYFSRQFHARFGKRPVEFL